MLSIDARLFFSLVAAIAAEGCTLHDAPSPERASDNGKRLRAQEPHGAPTQRAANSSPDAADGSETIAQAPCRDPAVGRPKSCAGLRPPTSGPACEGFEYTRYDCNYARTRFLPGVAERAVDCIMSQNGTQEVCGGREYPRCKQQAVTEACPDPAAASACSEIVWDCQDSEFYRTPPFTFTQRECQQMFAVIQDKWRKEFAKCLRGTCNRHCIWHLEPAGE